MTATPARARDLLRDRGFTTVLIGVLLSQLGDGCYLVAIAWETLRISDTPVALAVVGIAFTAPQVLVLLPGGVLADRLRRADLAAVSDLVRFAPIAAIGVLAILDATTLPLLVGLVVVYGIGEALGGPVSHAIVPEIVRPEHLKTANSLLEGVKPLVRRFVGPAVGGVAIGLGSSGFAFLLDAGTFLVSAACFLAVRGRTARRRPRGGTPFLRRAFSGLTYARHQPWFSALLLASAVGLVLNVGPTTGLVPYLVKNELGGSALDLSWVFGGGAIGSALGALAFARLRTTRPFAAMFTFFTIASAALVVYGFSTSVPMALSAAFVDNLFAVMGGLTAMTATMQRAPGDRLGSIFAVVTLVETGVAPLSYLAAGPLAEQFGVRQTMVGAGVLGALSMVPFVAWAHRTRVDAAGPVTAAEPVTAADLRDAEVGPPG